MLPIATARLSITEMPGRCQQVLLVFAGRLLDKARAFALAEFAGVETSGSPRVCKGFP